MYRIILKDKGNTQFSIDHPEDFLSEKSIERRNRQNLPVDSIDLPVDSAYLNAISATGAIIRAKSKWTGTVVAQADNNLTFEELKNLPFVDTLYCVRKSSTSPSSKAKDVNEPYNNEFKASRYGSAYTQISLNNGHLLHEAGFLGDGLTIAVIDGGFQGADKVACLDFSRVKGVKNFNHETSNPLESGVNHGTMVLSCMLANQDNVMVGTAPDAEYYLLRSEVSAEEFPVEEDYWVAALEYADSIGADIVTTSLGYSTFDDAAMNHTLKQLDGKAVPASRAANLAASRGLLLFNSAGNEGNNTWKKITFPADAENVITVGSVVSDSSLSYFSSRGYTADGRIKPDLAAMGSSVRLAISTGITTGSGTSFATPILAGLGACLWQAFPNLTAMEMLELLRKSGDIFQHPDSLTGFGIADVYKAYITKLASIPVPNAKKPENSGIFAYNNTLYINFNINNLPNSSLLLYSLLGNCIMNVKNIENNIDITSLPKGVYIAILKYDDRFVSKKFIKQ
jgi:subtilisin family serine protease